MLQKKRKRTYSYQKMIRCCQGAENNYTSGRQLNCYFISTQIRLVEKRESVQYDFILLTIE